MPRTVVHFTQLTCVAGLRCAALAVLLLAQIVVAPAALHAVERADSGGCDLDYDGHLDAPGASTTASREPGGALQLVYEDRDGDGELERGDEEPSDTPTYPAPAAFDFSLVWDSGSALSNVFCVEAGDANQNGVFDFAGPSFSPGVMHLFESNGAGGYISIWSSVAETPPGAYRDIAFADTDGDGLGEILGGELSTLGKVMLFEQAGGGFAFVHDTVRESDFTGGQQIRSVLTGDTDRDGQMEIIVVTGGSNPTGGVVGIWEHSGPVGSNTYTRVFGYETVSYVFQAAIGDSDGDDFPEIVLGLGGLGNNPLIIRRLEYDESAATWLHHSVTTSVIGLPLAPLVSDVDGDGVNELVYGSSGSQASVVVFESTGPNSYDLSFLSDPLLEGNVVATEHALTGELASPGFVAGSFGGDVGLWAFDEAQDTYAIAFTVAGLGGPVHQLEFADDGDDTFQEILPATGGMRDQVLVYRRSDIVGLGDLDPVADTAAVAPLRVLQNPVGSRARIAVVSGAERVLIFDVLGRLVRPLTVDAGVSIWDLRDASGARVRSGIYWARAAGAAGPAARIVVTR